MMERWSPFTVRTFSSKILAWKSNEFLTLELCNRRLELGRNTVKVNSGIRKETEKNLG